MYRFSGCTENANDALNRAIEKARELGHESIGSEHMILGILENGENPASHILRHLGITERGFEEKLKEKAGVRAPRSSPTCRPTTKTAPCYMIVSGPWAMSALSPTALSTFS